MNKKLKLILLGGAILATALVGINASVDKSANWNLLLKNIEAYARDEISIQNCPNGGQETRGEAKNKQWTERHKTDAEGKITINGSTLDYGLSAAFESVIVYCYSVECPGKQGSCILCNTWCNK